MGCRSTSGHHLKAYSYLLILRINLHLEWFEHKQTEIGTDIKAVKSSLFSGLCGHKSKGKSKIFWRLKSLSQVVLEQMHIFYILYLIMYNWWTICSILKETHAYLTTHASILMLLIQYLSLSTNMIPWIFLQIWSKYINMRMHAS